MNTLRKRYLVKLSPQGKRMFPKYSDLTGEAYQSSVARNLMSVLWETKKTRQTFSNNFITILSVIESNPLPAKNGEEE